MNRGNEEEKNGKKIFPICKRGASKDLISYFLEVAVGNSTLY